MNNRLSSTSSGEEFTYEHVPSSGNWNYTVISEQLPKSGRGGNVWRLSGLSILMAFSPMSTGLDPWWNDRRGQVNLSIAAIYNPIIRRRISILEARRLALTILYEAEDDRVRIAKAEAARSAEMEL